VCPVDHSETEEMMIVVEPSVVELAERCIAAVAPWTAGNAMYENQPVELASVAYDTVLEGTFLLGDQTSEVAQQQPWLQDSEQLFAQLEQPSQLVCFQCT
jgi:hypothetical protein